MTKRYSVTVNGTVYEVEVEELAEGAVSVPNTPVSAPKAAPISAQKAASKAAGSGTPVNAPMQGSILSVSVSAGQSIKKGDLVCVLEAMKMENEIFAPCDGKVTSVAVTKGQTVATGELIATIA